MVWPTAGSQVNVPDPEPDGPDEADPAEPDDDPGTTTVYDPASPTVPFSCVCSVSGPRVTACVLMAYALLLAAGLGELNTPAASAPPSAAATTTTTARARTQPRRRRRYPVMACPPATGSPAACPPRRAGSACPTDCSAPPGPACPTDWSTPPGPACPPAAGSPACSRASVLLIACHPSYAGRFGRFACPSCGRA